LAVLLCGCDTLDNRYTREGIGTEFYTAEVADAARLQDFYVGYICQQAGLSVDQVGTALVCREPSVSRVWEIFVQAGMNDIDRRCDGYLTWLDNKRRNVGPIHQQILDSEAATLAIIAATAVDPTKAIAVVAAAFGLAAHSFTNFNSRFLFEVEKSTVQSVVLTRQQKYRETLPIVIDNRPAAIYALRQYLRLCMPMTIETQINTTVKLFERGGTVALNQAAAHPMIDARTVSTATAVMQPARRAPVVESPIRVGIFEQRLEEGAIRDFQQVACLPADGKFTARTREGILKWLNANGTKDKTFPNQITAKDGTRLRDALDAGPSC
jgi:hypothetical protein